MQGPFYINTDATFRHFAEIDKRIHLRRVKVARRSPSRIDNTLPNYARATSIKQKQKQRRVVDRSAMDGIRKSNKALLNRLIDIHKGKQSIRRNMKAVVKPKPMWKSQQKKWLDRINSENLLFAHRLETTAPSVSNSRFTKDYSLMLQRRKMISKVHVFTSKAHSKRSLDSSMRSIDRQQSRSMTPILGYGRSASQLRSPPKALLT